MTTLYILKTSGRRITYPKRTCVLLLSIILLGCNSEFIDEEQRVINLVLDEMRCKDKIQGEGKIVILSGKIENGIGIFIFKPLPSLDEILNNSRVYWVKNSKVYWVSESAKNCSPHLEKAPEKVTPKAVFAAGE